MIDWDREWRAAHERSMLRVTSRNERRWRDFWSLAASHYLEEVKCEMPLYEMVIDRLLREGWARPSDRVLDIGSGPGTMALPLSRKVSSVTALDEAEGMIAVLKEECLECGIGNITTNMSSWNDAKYEDDFDLVLASLSPAVRCGDDLLAMERASRDRCCLITACPSDWMTMRNELWERVVGRFVPSDAYSVRYPLNLLLDWNRVPELFSVSYVTTVRHSCEDVIDHFIRYFQIFTEVDEDKAEIVRAYVLSRSREGTFVRESRKCLHLLCWIKGPASDRR